MKKSNDRWFCSAECPKCLGAGYLGGADMLSDPVEECPECMGTCVSGAPCDCDGELCERTAKEWALKILNDSRGVVLTAENMVKDIQAQAKQEIADIAIRALELCVEDESDVASVAIEEIMKALGKSTV